MNGNCIDTGTIQAFLDGELATSAAARVSSHLAACDACTSRLAAAEEESTLVFSVLEREMNSLVPTQRLWAKINDSIAVERQREPYWRKAVAFLSVQIASPSLAAAAALVVVAGLFAAVWVDRTTVSEPDQEVANIDSQTPEQPAPFTAGTAPEIQPVSTAVIATSDTAIYARANARTESARTGSRDGRTPNVSPAVYMPGEDSYVKTIANLTQNVNSTKEDVLRPSERVAYERDLAVVNDAIERLRKEVRRNPKNESAKQVLYTSYQNKIDLLNSVSQKEELLASLK
jgi:hypothetical protein